MGRFQFTQTSFLGGEWSPAVAGRFDAARYKTGMARCYNGYPVEEGAWIRRQGSELLLETYHGLPARMFSFEHSSGNTYQVEITNQRIRVYKNHAVLDATGITSNVPFLTAQLQDIRALQDEDTLYLFHPSWPLRALTRDNSEVFSVAVTALEDGPYFDTNTTTTTLTPSGTTGSITLTASATTGINDGQGFLTTDVGRQVRLYYNYVAPAFVRLDPYDPGDTVTYNGKTYSCILHVNVSDYPPLQPKYWIEIFQQSEMWTWATITARSSTTQVTATIEGIDLTDAVASTLWRMGLFSDTTGWPKAGALHEDRLVLLGPIANRIDFSMSGQHTKFSPTGTTGAVADDNAVAAVFAASDKNKVLWAEPDERGLFLGTRAAEWLVRATVLDDPLSPTNVQARRVMTYGDADTPPVRAGNSLIFLQHHKQKLLEIMYDGGRYSANNLSVSGRHLMTEGILRAVFQQEPYPIVWSIKNDGALLGLAFKREGDDVYAGWHQHELGANSYGAEVEDIMVTPAPGRDYEEVWLVVSRRIGDVNPNTDDGRTRYIEYLGKVFDDTVDIKDAFFVDCGIRLGSGNVSKSAGILTITGLTHLAGETAAVMVNGLDFGDKVVTTAGHITFEVPDEVTIDSSVVAIIGYPFTSEGQLLRPMEGSQEGQFALALTRRIDRFGVLLYRSGEVMFGTDLNGIMDKLPYEDVAAGVPLLRSGVFRNSIEGGDSFDGQIAWRIERPTPAMICALSGLNQVKEV